MQYEAMMDIETLDVLGSSVVTQLAVVVFDESGFIVERYQRNIDAQAQIDLGRTISWETLKFWMEQPDSARMSITAPESFDNLLLTAGDPFWTAYKEHSRAPLWLVRTELFDIARRHELKYWWSKGSFDFDIIEDLIKTSSGSFPWTFRQKQCLRTAVNLVPAAKEMARDAGNVAHSALGDCEHQVRQLCMVRSFINWAV